MLGRDLTARQAELWALIAEGLTNQQIARRLYICEKTVKNNVTALFAVIGCQSRSQAAVAFVRRGGDGRPASVSLVASPRRSMVRVTTERDLVTSQEARSLAAELLAAADAVDAAEIRRYRDGGWGR